MIYIGIDPGGSSGAIAYLDDGTAAVEELAGMTQRDIYTLLYDLSMGDAFALLEQVHTMPQQGIVSAFKFGWSCGELSMALTAADIPWEHILPVDWQKPFGLLRKRKEESKTEKKNRHKEAAERLFPGLKITHNTADALLIAEYCRRVRRVR